MELYTGYSSESDVFLLGYCNSSHAVRSEAVCAPGAMTSCSPGKAREEPNAEATPHPPSAEPVIAKALLLLGSGFPRAFSHVAAKNSSRPHEFAHSLLLGLWLAGFAANAGSHGSSALLAWAEQCWWRSCSRHGATRAAAAATPGVWHTLSLMVRACPTSGISKKVPPEPATSF